MPAGRPSTYDPHLHPPLAKWMARSGLKDTEIAQQLGITERALYRWKAKYAGFSQALKDGKEPVDIKVEDSLLKRALGYEYEETEVTAVKGQDNPRIKRIKKQMVPDVTACIFWLKNRAPERWRDKVDLAHSGQVTANHTLDLSHLSDEELRQLASIAERARATAGPESH